MISKGSHHNKILRNVMRYSGSWETDSGNMVMFADGAEHNLFEGNDLSYGGHNLMNLEARFNVVRNNRFHSHWERNLSITRAGYCLFEYNIITGAAKASDNPTPPGMKVEGRANIVRRNLYYRNIGAGFSTSVRQPQVPESTRNKIYHNVYVDNKLEVWSFRIKTYQGADENVFQNNIGFRNGPETVVFNAIGTKPGKDPLLKTRFVANNLPGGPLNIEGIGTRPLSWFQQRYPQNFTANLVVDPQLVNPDAAEPDFHLRPGSPCIDAGAFLTRTTSAGSGKTMEVEDVGYFCDGFDIVEGGCIQLEGQSQTARIMGVDYDRNVLTLDRALQWAAGQGVSQPYRGKAPDIGAYEYE
jgi:hypothetical protein